MKPQEIFSHKIPELDIRQANRPNSTVEALQRGERNHAVSKIGAVVKRKTAELDYIDYRKYTKTIKKAVKDKIERNKARKIVKAKRIEKNETIVLSEAPKARLSDVHVTTRPGATKTRTFDKNQQISELIQQQPARQGSETAISNAATTPAKGRGNTLKTLKPLPSPDSELKRGRVRPSNVSSGKGESPRPIGSARTILFGTSSPNLAAKK